MHCDDARQTLGAWHDGELSSADRREIAAHVAQCPACAEHERSLRRLGAAVSSLRAKAPKGLEARVRAAIADAEGATTAATAAADATTVAVAADGKPRDAAHAPAPATWTRASVLRAMAATAVLGTGAGWLGAVGWLGHDAAVDRVTRDVVAAHMRSLVGDTPVQIAASDQHVVKPWFAGRVDFAPTVPDLAARGFTLVGGRIDVVGGRRVGVAVYKRRLHVINVFMWLETGDPPARATPRTSTAQGYNLVQWDHNGIAYWAISDLNARELSELPPLL